MKRWIMWLFLMVLGFVMFIILFNYNMQQIKHDSIVATLQSQTKTTFISSYDASYRTEDRGVSLNAIQFEESLLPNILENASYNLRNENPSIEVKYLVVRNNETLAVNKVTMKRDDMIKAVMVSFTVNRSTYTMRFIVDEIID